MFRRWLALRPWPLALAAIAAFIIGTRLLTDAGDKELAAAALISMGAVCLGAWISMLAAHDYTGREPDDTKETDGKP